MMQSPSDIMLAMAEFSDIAIPVSYQPGVLENLALIHARTDFPREERRLMRRCTVEGVPVVE